jgi:hypothetical protein
MATVEVRLSAAGLANIRHRELPDKFTFIVGAHRHECPSIPADFLSPRVSDLHSIDPTLSELSLDVSDPGGVFDGVLLLGRGATIGLESSLGPKFGEFRRELRNWELPDFESITASNVFDRLLGGSGNLLELEFIASHFCELSEKMSVLDNSTVCAIISHPSLKIESEDWLYDFIANRPPGDFLRLAEFILFEHLSASRVCHFLDLVADSISEIDLPLLRRLLPRLACEVCSVPHVELPPAPSDPLNGIIAHLARVCRGNVCDHGVVAVTGSSQLVEGGAFAPKNAANLSDDSLFWSGSGTDEWLCYDFTLNSVHLTYHTVQSKCRGWVLEGSTDGKLWIELDKCPKNESKSSAAQPVQTRELFRRIRVRGNGPLIISRFEVFGMLAKSKRMFASLKPLEGIIAHLTAQGGGNVHDRHVVNVTSSPPFDTHAHDAKNAVDLHSDTQFWSNCHFNEISHTRNNWICLDFKRRRVIPTHITIRSRCGVGGCNLKSWIIEVSVDGQHWTKIGHWENNSDLNKENTTCVFPVTEGEICRFLRLVNIGKNHFGHDMLAIAGFEVFDTLIEGIEIQ